MNNYMYSDGTVKVEDVVKNVSGFYTGKAIGDPEFIDDYISNLLDGEEVFIDYFEPDSLYKLYTASRWRQKTNLSLSKLKVMS